MNRVRKFLRLPVPVPAPAVEPLPVPADGDTSASHMRHAHKEATLARIEHGRWLAGHDCIDLDRVDEQASDAIEHLKSFRSCLSAERKLLAEIGEA